VRVFYFCVGVDTGGNIVPKSALGANKEGSVDPPLIKTSVGNSIQRARRSPLINSHIFME